MRLKSVGKLAVILAASCCGMWAHADAIWIDVRSVMEHAVDHIEGDMRITHDKITQKVSELLPDKSTEIKLYCRSGGRAGKAASALMEAGYTNVSNAGGIEDAREERGLKG